MNEFAVDLSLSELERIETYTTATIDAQRYGMHGRRVMASLVHVRLMNDAIRKYSMDDIKEHILPLLEEVSNDPVEAIQIELCTVFGTIVSTFAEDNMDDGCGVAEGLILPLFWSMVMKNCDSVFLSHCNDC